VQPQGVQSILPIPPADVIVTAKSVWAQNRKRADILLVVDVSGSMNDDNKIEQAKAGLETFLARILPEDRVGLVIFSSSTTLLVPPALLSENRIQLGDAIQGMQAEGKTAVFDGLIAGKKALDSLPPLGDERIKAIVLLSDGQDNSSTMTIDQLKQEFQESNISIFPVAYGADADITALQQIVDFSRTILVKGSSGDIGQIFDNLSRYF
jgi:Ca-activated chloride channel family protein